MSEASPGGRRLEEMSPEERQRHMDNLRAVYASLQQPVPATRAPGPATVAPPAGAAAPGHPSHKGRWGALGTVGALLVFLAGKLKFLGLLAGALKLKTFATMALSVGAYATQWGWAFALGFVLLIFVHELGHLIAMKREGIPAGAPVFIPFVGAFIAMKGMPRDAYVEAKVGIGGPLLGSLGAWAVLAYGLATGSRLFIALGHVGVMLNLFNLIPVSPLDGGRIAGAFSRAFWIVGYAIGIVAFVLTLSPILLLVLLVGLWTLWQRWRSPVPGYDAIPRGKRLLVAGGYAALIVALLATMPLGEGVAGLG
jgi:Zn-dependent protease